MEEDTSDKAENEQQKESTSTAADESRPTSSASSSGGTGRGAAAAAAAGMTGATLPPDALDYFSETAAKLGTGSSTGVMIQSPDGRPAGIFFHPRTNSSSTIASAASGGGGGGGGSGASSGTARTPGIASTMMARRGSGEERFAAAIASGSALKQGTSSSALISSSSTSGAVAPDGASNLAPVTGEAVTSLPTSSGSLFAPSVGLQSIFSRQRPPTATPLRQAMEGETENENAIKKISLDALHEKGNPSMTAKDLSDDRLARSREAVKGDKADRNDAEPKSPLDSADTTGKLPFSSLSPPASGAQAQGAAAAGGVSKKRQSMPASVGRQSFGTDGLSARQTFSSALASTATARPSAQPQSGLLIGAGFSQPRRKGGLSRKRSSGNIEVLPPIKVLIVEDNPINLKILATFLKQRKIKFGVARDGREAVKEWEQGGYHLILMDIQLPVMDGIEATKEIRRLEQMANIAPVSASTPGTVAPNERSAHELGGPGDFASKPNADSGTTSPYTMLQNSLRASVIIVALTASVLNSDRVAALAAGCNDFLNKPVDLRWLERKVIEWGSMQYLISFREWPATEARNGSRANVKGAAPGVRRAQIAPTQEEVLRSEGLVDTAFNVGPDKLARELAGRLYIGGKKTKTDVTASTEQTNTLTPA